jgi:glycosyltransferase involved in cell wall biosynthesis
MRVLYISPNSNLGSTTSSLNAIIQNLRPRGLQPVMYFQEPGPWQRELEMAGIPCYFGGLANPGKNRLFASIRDIWRLCRLVRRERIDLIHCNEHQNYSLLRQVARWTGTPTVVTLHWNLDPGFGQWAFRPPFEPSMVQFLSKKQKEVSIAGLPAGFNLDRTRVLMSGLAIDDLLSRGGDGSDLRRQWNVGPSTVVVGTASAIKSRKHLDHFVTLIGRLRRQGLDVFGAIAGGGKYVDPAYQQQLVAQIAAEGLVEHCRLIGFVNPITPFFRACDITVNTSEMEILSMSLCEAQACRRPTLAYAVGGNPETLPPWNIVPFGDVDALEQKVVSLVTKADLRREKGLEAEQFVRSNFDAPLLAARQQKIYEEVLGDQYKLLPVQVAS